MGATEPDGKVNDRDSDGLATRRAAGVASIRHPAAAIGGVHPRCDCVQLLPGIFAPVEPDDHGLQHHDRWKHQECRLLPISIDSAGADCASV